MDRRRFLIALPLLAAARPHFAPVSSIGIALGEGAAGSGVLRGLHFGTSEAPRAAGPSLAWLEATGRDALARLAQQGAALVIALGEVGPARTGGPPVLRVPLAETDSSNCGGDEWHVGPTREQRAAAIDAFRRMPVGRALPPLVAPRVRAWHHALEKFGAAQLNERFARAFSGARMDEDAWLGWIAARVALESAVRGTPAQHLRAAEFAVDGHKGVPLRFDALTRRLLQPLYILDPRRPDAPPLGEFTPAAVPAACSIG